jgi:hypothetical protein
VEWPVYTLVPAIEGPLPLDGFITIVSWRKRSIVPVTRNHAISDETSLTI